MDNTVPREVSNAILSHTRTKTAALQNQFTIEVTRLKNELVSAQLALLEKQTKPTLVKIIHAIHKGRNGRVGATPKVFSNPEDKLLKAHDKALDKARRTRDLQETQLHDAERNLLAMMALSNPEQAKRDLEAYLKS